MFKKYFFILLFGLLLPISLFSQDNILKHSFQAKPLTYLGNILRLNDDPNIYLYEFSFEYQMLINNYLNLSVAPYFYIEKIPKQEYYYFWDGEKIDMGMYEYYLQSIFYGINPGIIIRPFGYGFNGFYIKPYSIIGLIHYNIIEENIFDKNFKIGFMFELGYQWIHKNGFTIAAGAGIGKTWLIGFKNNELIYRDNNLIELGFNFSLGYSF